MFDAIFHATVLLVVVELFSSFPKVNGANPCAVKEFRSSPPQKSVPPPDYCRPHSSGGKIFPDGGPGSGGKRPGICPGWLPLATFVRRFHV